MSPINSLWFKWKGLRLPWRRSFLAGSDLSGNTYWEFKETLSASRLRRIVRYNPKTHYADIKVSPQWHQWLRYVRADPPSIQEQQQDIVRQIQMKHLARLADERWASKPSYLDKPQTQQPEPALRTSDPTLRGPEENAPSTQSEGTESTTEQVRRHAEEKNPWAKANAGNPSDSWQPEPWTPTAARK
ncbi:uncharacterized protein ASPGLDRAFT_49397 [Aspergillus glaucus CBS 516.65]|uniref:Uncharacterized protein n=1 Tax=Aspergillus glaucus CBS 516.65 TaxID=1160497 RepID=A0A1L9VDQ0_ASPGL|nr:hypothetical protein ASPGLDRAFT_49397 [Aspergillus glaucus CBS 516.65]OJJ82013.1 hypothetical protein ASPGLDRAFT_49397 [Aspergillus glaucus CBS 516.65]